MKGNKFLIVLELLIAFLPMINFCAQYPATPLEGLTEQYINGALSTDKYFQQIEESKDPETQTLASKIKDIREIEYDPSHNIYNVMTAQINNIKQDILRKIGPGQPYVKLMRQAQTEIQKAIEQQLNNRNQAIANQEAFPILPKKISTQSWLPDWLVNKGANLWGSAVKKASQVKSLAARYIPQSIKDRVNMWSKKTQLAVFSAIVGALAMAHYNKDILMQTVQDLYNKK